MQSLLQQLAEVAPSDANVLLTGENGAGKSTLLKAIFGLVKVREGKISLYGDDITNLKANKLVDKSRN